MEKGKDLLHISITKRVVPRCVYSKTQKFHLLRIELSDHSFSGHTLLGLLIFNFNVGKIHTYVNSLDRQVEEVLENPSFVVSLLSRPCLYFKKMFSFDNQLGRVDVVVGALEFRSDGRWFEVKSPPSCCFL